MQNYQNIPNQAKWLPISCFPKGYFYPSFYEWLSARGSMTSRLRKQAKESFRVEPLSESWTTCDVTEALYLGIELKQQCYVREAYLYVDHEPWIFGRTIIPWKTYLGKLKPLIQLGNRPVGDILFKHPNIERGEFEIAKIYRGEKEYERALTTLDAQEEYYWGRRSIFTLEQHSVLVSEIFLPSLYTKMT